mmetsp:Transcript_22486/g.16999  ORF Transcript_22486/g.16999 Transcript_22486/m.16999 type:complete len:82 (+) Transcript_22486:456-701(+)
MAFCRQNGEMQHFETSAKDNINVEKVFKDLASKVVLRQDEINQTPGATPDGNKKLTSVDKRGKPLRPDGQPEEKKKSDCCK